MADNDAQVIVRTAQEAASPRTLEPGVAYGVLIPGSENNAAHYEVVDTERFLTAPSRKRGSVTFSTGASLEAYVNKHAIEGATEMFADVDNLRVVAVLNGHAKETTGWGDHRATLQLRHTPEWKRWAAKDGQLVDQVQFAEHIEQGLAEIVEPPAAEMLELAQTFQANTKVVFRSSNLLNNGQRQLQYEETMDAKAGEKGNLVIPPSFTIGVAPFEGADPYRISARLRFRIREGHLTIGYSLDRPDVVLRTAFDDVLTSLESATGMAVYHGTPSAQ